MGFFDRFKKDKKDIVEIQEKCHKLGIDLCNSCAENIKIK